MGVIRNPDIEHGTILLLSPNILKGSADSYDNSAWGPEIFDEINDEYSDIFRGLLEHEMEHALDYEDGYNIFGTRHIQIMTELKAFDAQYNYFRNNPIDRHRHPELYDEVETYWGIGVEGSSNKAWRLMRDKMQYYNKAYKWGLSDETIKGYLDEFLDWY